MQSLGLNAPNDNIFKMITGADTSDSKASNIDFQSFLDRVTDNMGDSSDVHMEEKVDVEPESISLKNLKDVAEGTGEEMTDEQLD